MEEEEKEDYSNYNLGALQEVIGKLESNPPKDKRKIEFKEYVAELNMLMQIYNAKAGEKIYRIIKL